MDKPEDATDASRGRSQPIVDYRLDNAAKIFPGMLSKGRPTMFRVAARIDEPVNIDRLNEAYRIMLHRVPQFHVELRRGLFWYYLEHSDAEPRIDAESRYPCMYLPYKRRGVLPHRVIAYRDRVAFEVSHMLSDGRGAMAFLNGLLVAYFRLRGETIDVGDAFIDPAASPDPAESEDSFRTHYQRGVPAAGKSTPALKFTAKALKPPQFRVFEGVVESDALRAQAKKHGVTVGEFVTALIIDTAREEMEARGMRPLPIRVAIPIDLRRFFPSKTMRNFALAVEPGIDPRLGDFHLYEIAERVHHFMRSELDYRYIRRQIARNIRSELNPVIRAVPRVLKDPFLRWAYAVFGTRGFTVGFSNLGRVTLPERMAELVREYQFAPPRHNNALNATSVAYAGKTHLLFASSSRDKSLEARFFAKVRTLGIPVELRTNWR